jgi:hypothetical protein
MITKYLYLVDPVPQQVLHVCGGPPALSGTLPVPRHIGHLLTLPAIDHSFYNL